MDSIITLHLNSVQAKARANMKNDDVTFGTSYSRKRLEA